MRWVIERKMTPTKPFVVSGYIVTATLILAASVLLPMRALTVPTNDFLLIAWNHTPTLSTQQCGSHLSLSAVDANIDAPFRPWIARNWRSTVVRL